MAKQKRMSAKPKGRRQPKRERPATNENAKLRRQLAEARREQVAAAEILKVISRSSNDLRPVLDAIAETAARLCNADFAFVYKLQADSFHLAASSNANAAWVQYVRDHPVSPGRGTVVGRTLLERQTVHIKDVLADLEYTDVQRQRLGNYRTILGVPLLHDQAPIGSIILLRSAVKPFSVAQINLVETFADQAVIAIENVRLFDEVQARTGELEEALQRQTATADVLEVINSSPGNLAPVFEMILQKARDLYGVAFGSLQICDGEDIRAVAIQGTSERFAELVRRGYRAAESPSGRAFLEGQRYLQIDDARESDFVTLRGAAEIEGFRTVLYIPLRQEGRLLGTIAAARREVRPFSEREIGILEGFATQAAIAIENARLINETQEALERQTATADVLKVISRSTVDLETVLETLCETVGRLCRADQAPLYRRRDDKYHLAATWGMSEEGRQFAIAHPLTLDRGTMTGRVVLERRTIHIPDVLQDPEYTYSEGQKAIGYRTLLGIPLLREDALIGIFAISRARVEPFTDKEIELASSFADQAVIAIENARLFEELQERQAELRVTFDNMGDGVVMFDADARLAAWNRNFQEMLDLPDAFLAGRPSYPDYFRYLAERGEYSPDLEAQLSSTVDDMKREVRLERTRPDGRVIEVRRNAVPDGGFVMIYADITERKRAEEAIRLARDAAQKALRDLQMAQDRLVQTQKLASLGQLTAGIAHEIKNPLNFVNNFATLSVELTDELRGMLEPAALDQTIRTEVDEITGLLKDNLGKVVQHGKRADSIVRNMLLHSREGSGEQRPADVNALVEESLNLAYHGARAEKSGFEITLQRELDSNAGIVEMFPQEVSRALLNLISNGFYAATKRKAENGGADIEPIVLATTRDLGSSVEIRIRDNGTGIPPDVREKMFNPFFTTKPTGEGTGLGLSMTHDIIVKQHGGRIDVETRLGEFTEFIIVLPRNNRTDAG